MARNPYRARVENFNHVPPWLNNLTPSNFLVYKPYYSDIIFSLYRRGKRRIGSQIKTKPLSGASA
jgi:hypothetical protein